MKSSKRRRRAATLLSVLMALSIAGCNSGGTNATDPADNSSKIEDTAATETTVSTDDSEAVSEDKKESQGVTDVEESSTSNEVNDVVEDPLKSDEKENDDIQDDNAEDVITEAANEKTEDSAQSDNGNQEERDDGLTPTMRNSINMLNHMTSLTQRVNEEKGNQMFLESAYNSFDNLYPNSVDTKTQAQITSLMDTIQGYRMISVKRERLEYIYEQNRAQALRKAIPNPIGLLSAVSSGDPLKLAASVLYMAIDSANSYQAATSQADLQFIKDGWELDDAESNELHNSTKNALNYMYNMVRDYDIVGDYALSKESVEDFVTWSSKPDSQLERKISWFETNQKAYSEFGPYWLELAKDYYNYGDYEKCLDAVNQYETKSTRIFRKDIDYAKALPMAIVSAKETMNDEDYVKVASNYCAVIHDNTKDEDWTIRYFTAQIYMDLYAITKDTKYLDEAYKIARENVVVLVDEQKSLNSSYLADIVEVNPGKDATKREKEEAKNYNKLIKEERKIALPPVSEALYLNSDLLFALAKERNIDANEQKRVEAILHENGENIFLTRALDDRFWFNKETESLDENQLEVSFEGSTFIIPASCITDRSIIVATISGTNGTTTLEDWKVENVKRQKGSKDCSEFSVTYKSNTGDKYKYKGGETVSIKVVPVEEAPDEYMEFTYNVVATKKVVVKGVKFERVTK